MSFHAVRHFWQILLRVLQEVRGGAVRFQRGIVFVLLVDKEAASFRLVAVHLVHGTARFFAGILGEFLKQGGNFSFVPNFRHPGNGQHHHRSLLPVQLVCRGGNSRAFLRRSSTL